MLKVCSSVLRVARLLSPLEERIRSLKRPKLPKLTLLPTTVLRTWPTLPTLVTLASSGILSSDTKTNSSTPTLVSSVLPSTPTRGTLSTLSAPWSSMLARGGTSAGPTSSPLLKEPTRVWFNLASTSPSLSLESLVLERPRIPRRSSLTSPPSAPLARGRREKHPLRTRLSTPTLS